MTTFQFHRKNLAMFYWEGLQKQTIRSFRSGLFLTAPRRTGKSTFLRSDFIPYVTDHGGLPIIVDLWEDPSLEMVFLLEKSLTKELERHSSFFAKAAKKTGLSRLNVSAKNVSAEFVPGAQLSVAESLTDLILRLHEAAKKPIVLIIDEAQHALRTESGKNGMFALKAARDALNLGQPEPGLLLVFTGSNRDKLAELVTRKSHPFYGSEIEKFPLLDHHFVQAYADYLKGTLGTLPFDLPVLAETFDLLGKKPDTFFQTVQEAVEAKISDKDGALRLLAEKKVKDAVQKIHERVESLPETQRLVLETLLASKDNFSPFSADTLKTYGVRKNGKKMTIPVIQKALDALREKGFLWRSSYGDYALEDDALLDWHKTLN